MFAQKIRRADIASCVLLLVVLSPSRTFGQETEKRLNVLLICVDDLRPQINCYGVSGMATPNLDLLAAEGRRFEHQYVQVPTCGASRCSMLTGRYPHAEGAYDNDAFLALPTSNGADVSMPRLFRDQGYRTISIGKITHRPDGLRDDTHTPELAEAWDEVGMPTGRWRTAWDAFFAYADGSTRVPGKTPATERADVGDRDYPDGLIADAAVEKLEELKGRPEPFFLAVGFIKPHLPFNAPATYWALYDEQQISLASNRCPPLGVDPTISLHRSSELTPRYTGLATAGVVTDAEARRLRHGYYACVSYVDAQIGRVLRALDENGLTDETIVVVWGDHGWHLGEHGIWGKHTLHEAALRSPLIIRTPHITLPGEATNGIVESVDLFPTLTELCRLPRPEGIDGSSFASLLTNPSGTGKSAALGFWANGRAHSIRTPRHRLTRWSTAKDRDRPIQIELYDHQLDPEETVNIASDHPEVVRPLLEQLERRVPLLQRQSGG